MSSQIMGGRNWECTIMVRHWGREKRFLKNALKIQRRRKVNHWLATSATYLFICLFPATLPLLPGQPHTKALLCCTWMTITAAQPRRHLAGNSQPFTTSLLFFSQKTSVVAGEWKQTSLFPFLAALRARDSSVLLWFYFILSLLLWWLYIWFVYLSTIPYGGLAAVVLYYKETSLYSTM